ncbi:MAG: methyl-accepting chemotaxis protein [Pseudomonadota bacterium]
MSERPRRPLTISVFVRCAAIVALATLVLASMLSLQSYRLAMQVGHDGRVQLAQEVTGLVASQSGGGLRFDKPDDLANLFDETIESLGSSARDAMGLSVSGGQYLSGGAASVDPALRTLAQRAIDTAEPVFDPERLLAAHPVRFGSDAQIVGAIAMAWSMDATTRMILDTKRRSLTINGTVFLITLFACALIMRRMLSVPLRSVGNTMSQVGQGDYSAHVPQTKRRDEIGAIARSLAKMRDDLRTAEARTADGNLKGAGFDGSSAALCLLDCDGTITHMNAAFRVLYGDHAQAFQLDPDAVIGAELATLHPGLAGFVGARDASSTSNSPYELQLAGGYLELSQNAIRDDDGTVIGTVIEWQDVTKERLDQAILSTLEDNQVKAVFAPSGRLIDANPIFLELLGRDAAAARKLGLSEVLSAEDPALPAVTPKLREAVVGTFAVETGQPAKARVEGALCPVLDRGGAVMCLVLIGLDVTATRAAVARADADRAAMEAEQAKMIDALRDGLAQLSDGNLTIEIQTPFDGQQDALRSDFNGAVGNLKAALVAVTEHSGLIRGEVAEISSAADDLSRRTEHQAATLEETAAALAEITASVSSAAEGARQANAVVGEARDNAAASGNVVRDAVAAMGEIADSSSKISSIISVIDDIAFQTNLLALNAGVEAARAGDAGRGFAVVASEVRALAQRSSDAAREINTLISTSGGHVERGVTLVGDAGDALERIVESVSGISDHVAAIATSAQEQSAGLAQVNTAMSQLDQVTQQNAAMFEETTAASQALNAAAQELGSAVSRFDLGTVAPGPRPHTTPAPPPAAAKPAATGDSAPAFISGRGGPVASAAVVDAAPATPDAEPLVLTQDDDWEEF